MMHISIKTTNHVLAESSRELLNKKFGRLERLLRGEEVARLAVEVEEMPLTEKDGVRFRVEANLQSNGALYRAEARSGKLEAAIEKVRHELEAELRRVHGRTRRLLRRGGTILKDALRGWR